MGVYSPGGNRMFELLGALLGGIFRVFPEVLKFFDQRNERAHELAKLEFQLRFQELTGRQKIDELSLTTQAAYDVAAMSALQEAIKSQGKLTGVGWIDGISMTVRPFVTYLLLALYMGAKLGSFVLAVDSGMGGWDAIVALYNPEDRALLAGILNFWFLSRVFEKVYR